MQKLYCYVDENGMETAGRIFIVAVVVLEEDPAAALAFCEEAEALSGKEKTKWGRAEQTRRIDYLRRVFRSPALRGRLSYAVFQNTRNFEAATIDAIARAVKQSAPQRTIKPPSTWMR